MKPLGRKAKDITEPSIERNERTLLARADIQDARVCDPRQSLITHADGIMTACAHEPDFSFSEVLIELELHRSLWVGTGMIFSRAASAP